MNQIKIGFVQINSSFANQNYFPYSVGRLQAYAQKYAKSPERHHFLTPIFSRIPVQKAVDQMRNADVVAFSSYVWNIKISLEMAKRMKEENPEKLVVFGGPQVPDKPEAFLRQNTFIDIACHGEGETIFLEILQNSSSRNWEGIPSVSFLTADGTFVSNPRGTRIQDLSAIPSPYLEGVFDPLIKACPDEHWIALWESNRGCPFSCTFCDWGSAIAAKVFTFDMKTVFQEIDWFGGHKIGYVVCCDANFGMLPRDLDIAKYAAETKKKFGFPKTISIQNTKNATERSYEVQKIIATAGMNNGVTLSMQSLDPETLKSIRRQNISLGSYQELQRRFTRDDVETYTDLILALPGETYDSFFNGVSQAITNGQHNRILFNICSVLPNAEMGNPEYQKKYGMELVETKAINIHGSLIENEDEIYETQYFVVATNTMPREAWVKTRMLGWMVALLHFDKLLQVPLIILHEICDFSYRELFEVFMDSHLDAYPVLKEIREFFREKALDIQNGGAEFCNSPEWLNIWWPADEYILIKLSVENKLETFYEETEAILGELLKEKSMDIAPILKEAILMNKNLINQPFQTQDLDLELSYNIWEFYQAARKGIKIPLENQPIRYHIDRTAATWSSWEDWFKEVVWYGSKRGAYFNKNVVSVVP